MIVRRYAVLDEKKIETNDISCFIFSDYADASADRPFHLIAPGASHVCSEGDQRINQTIESVCTTYCCLLLFERKYDHR